MKIEYDIEAVEDGYFRICFSSENTKETYEMVHLAKQIKKPVRSVGSITPMGAVLWIKIPIMKRDYHATEIGNIK